MTDERSTNILIEELGSLKYLFNKKIYVSSEAGAKSLEVKGQ